MAAMKGAWCGFSGVLWVVAADPVGTVTGGGKFLKIGFRFVWLRRQGENLRWLQIIYRSISTTARSWKRFVLIPC
jgi:hypothetical protein